MGPEEVPPCLIPLVFLVEKLAVVSEMFRECWEETRTARLCPQQAFGLSAGTLLLPGWAVTATVRGRRRKVPRVVPRRAAGCSEGTKEGPERAGPRRCTGKGTTRGSVRDAWRCTRAGTAGAT